MCKFTIYCLALVLCGCYSQRPTTVPITNIKYASATNQTAHLVIFLIGIGDNISAFERAGFFKRKAKFKFDSIVVDSHFGFYKNHSISTRIFEDILKSSRSKYKKITLLGISLGGYGAIKTASDYPTYVDNIILVAPFLGSQGIAKMQARHQSYETWRPTENTELGYFEDSWNLLYKLLKIEKIPLTLAYGKEDKFAMQSNQLAKYLNQENVVKVKGKHNWQTWLKIWTKLLTLKIV
ncbi:MAG: alpha/beta hydrolase-fold protein [Kangiellaceae bacterium]